MRELGLLFVGIAIGSLNPVKSIWGWLIPLAIATFFVGVDMFEEYKDNQGTGRVRKRK